MELNEKEMKKVNGGVCWKLVGVVGTLITFFVGLVSGYTNPTRCNN